MEARERLLETFRCETVDRPPYLCEFGPWYETLLRWEGEGMTPVWNWQDGLGLDPPIEKLAVELGFCPAFEEAVLEDRGDRVLRRNRHGVVEEQMKETRPVAHPVDFPLKTREDWLRLKRERLDPEDPGNRRRDRRDAFSVDTDGDVGGLLPGFLDPGVERPPGACTAA